MWKRITEAWGFVMMWLAMARLIHVYLEVGGVMSLVFSTVGIGLAVWIYDRHHRIGGSS